MGTIFNETDHLFTPCEQQKIQNAMAWQGVDEVYTQRQSLNEEDKNLFHFYENEDFSNYLFSIDVDADGGCVIYDR
ncbi:MAG: hypothetical protein PHX09_04460 [Clostridia bacterium]|nr:hypothetical protein [Clostridia bacterium]